MEFELLGSTQSPQNIALLHSLYVVTGDSLAFSHRSKGIGWRDEKPAAAT